MPRKTTKRPHYRTPIRSRKEIADYLASIGGYYSTHGHNGRSCFSFDVKCCNARLDLDHLIEVYRTAGCYGDDETWLDNPEWLEQAEARYGEVARHLFDWGVEDAARLVTDSDCYMHLYDGTAVEVEYGWMGRSGGHLGIRRLSDLSGSR